MSNPPASNIYNMNNMNIQYPQQSNMYNQPILNTYQNNYNPNMNINQNPQSIIK